MSRRITSPVVQSLRNETCLDHWSGTPQGMKFGGDFEINAMRKFEGFYGKVEYQLEIESVFVSMMTSETDISRAAFHRSVAQSHHQDKA